MSILLNSTSISELTELLQTRQPAAKSQAAVKSFELQEKIDLLKENVEKLLNQDRNINREIKEIKSNVESVKNGLSNQIQQINVSQKYKLLSKHRVYAKCSIIKSAIG